MTEIKAFFAAPKSRQEVAAFFGCSDRDARSRIAELRESGLPIVNLSDGNGYFLAEGKALEEYIAQEYSRGWNVIRTARKMAKLAGVDTAQLEWVTDDDD